jgi:F-type H+-transporting ATPase subunit b
VIAHAPLADSGLLDINATLFAEILAFLIMLGILAKYAYPPIIRLAEERQRKIEEGVRAAEEAEKLRARVEEEVQKILAEHREQAREILTRAHREATADADAMRVSARQESAAILDKARADIEAERDRAIQELRTQVSALVVEAAGKVLGQAIDAKAHQRLIEESIASVGSRN